MKKWLSIIIFLGLGYILFIVNNSDKEIDQQIDSFQEPIDQTQVQTVSKSRRDIKPKTNNKLLENSIDRQTANKKHPAVANKKSIQGFVGKVEKNTPHWLEYFDEEVVLNGDQFKISNQLIAVKKSATSNSKSLFEVGGFDIVETNLSEDELNESKNTRVLYNNSTKRLNLLTGHLFLTLRNDMNEVSLAEKFGVEIVGRVQHLGILEVRPDEGRDIFEVEQSLLASNEFRNVEVEIIEGSIYEK